MQILQPLPTRAGDVGTLARQLLRLVGPAYPAPDGSTNAADALALGAALSDARATTAASLDEAFPITALRLLSEWESMLGLPDGAGRVTTEKRQLALFARWRTRFAGTPSAILTALESLSQIAPTMRETLARDSHANPRRVYAFTIRVDATALGTSAIYDTVAVMKPAHTAAFFTSKSLTAGFFCNDPDSLTNNTVL